MPLFKDIQFLHIFTLHATCEVACVLGRDMALLFSGLPLGFCGPGVDSRRVNIEKYCCGSGCL